MPKKTASPKASDDDLGFGDVISAGSLPGRGSSNKYDAVVERAQSLAIGAGLPFQAPSTSSLTRLKKRLGAMGYALTTRTNPDNAEVNPGGVTAYVLNNVGKGIAPKSSA